MVEEELTRGGCRGNKDGYENSYPKGFRTKFISLRESVLVIQETGILYGDMMKYCRFPLLGEKDDSFSPHCREPEVPNGEGHTAETGYLCVLDPL